MTETNHVFIFLGISFPTYETQERISKLYLYSKKTDYNL